MICRREKVFYLTDMPLLPLSEAHSHYLSLPFVWECPKNGFEDGEIGWLSRYGSWCRALMLGVIEPDTPAHRRFVVLANNFQGPVSLLPHERLWLKYLENCKSQGVGWVRKKPEPQRLKTLDLLADGFDMQLKSGLESPEFKNSGHGYCYEGHTAYSLARLFSKSASGDRWGDRG